MEPFTVQTIIDRPREEIYEYLSDVANHPEFTDHYLVDWHMLREDTYGVGAGGRFRSKMPRNRFAWADATIHEMQPPYRILMRGRGGKYNRIRMLSTWTLQPAPGGTRVQYTFETESKMPSDKLMEILGGRSWTRRKAARSIRRLRSILEDGKGRGKRATVDGVRTPAPIRPLATPPSTPHR